MEPGGRVLHFKDTTAGRDYLDRTGNLAFASVKKSFQYHAATGAALRGDRLVLTFAEAAAEVELKVTPQHRRLVLEVMSVKGDDIDEVVFGQVPLTLQGDVSEPFGASLLAMNLKTNCPQYPGTSSELGGFTAYRRFGFIGACGAIVAGPMAELRDALKDAARSAPDLPHSPLGGPWALDAEINQGSYIIDGGGTITEENVGDWIEVARQTGATQIDFHGGHSFRWGDFEPNRALYPRGRVSLKAVVDAIHEAGLAAGLHTYAFFMAKDTPWVTPVPHADLGKDATFTLSAELDEKAAVVPVDETTEAMSTVTGFHVRNSVTLQIDDELITYSAISQKPPYAFADCTRGAYGTRPATHGKGAKVHHLKECFGLFTPEGNSELFTEVAERTADLYNECGFDMLYLDALDGSDIVGGWEYAWHYGAKFVYELAKRLEKPAVLEMSTFTHHLWVVRSRMEAWDVPSRAQKSFVDIHVLRNRRWENAFLPTHLGWWGVFDWDGIHPERSFTDDFEYVCVKALATDSSLSYLVGFTPNDMRGDNAKRMAAIAKRYEALRHSKAVPVSIKQELAAPGREFTLRDSEDGAWEFLPATYSHHPVTLGSEAQRFTVANAYEAQPLRFRIQTDLSTDSWESPRSTTLTRFAAGEFAPAKCQEGVAATLTSLPEDQGAVLVATNDGTELPRAWATFTKEFEAPVDVRRRGLGVWIDGDGQGEVLNFQLRSPDYLGGGLADHYVRVDFVGRRYVALVEPESAELTRYQWPHTRRWQDFVADPARSMAFAYPMYHIWVNYEKIGSLTVGVVNLPPGKTVQVGLGPVKAVPVVPRTLIDPVVTVSGRTLKLPVSLESGAYLEYLGPEDCKVYDAKGNLSAIVSPSGEDIELEAGNTTVEVSAVPDSDGPVRATVTVMRFGKALNP